MNFMTVFKFLMLTFILHSGCTRKAGTSPILKGIETNTVENKIDGSYKGLQELEALIDPSMPQRKWFHLTKLKIMGDSVKATQSPITIHNGDTSFSVSDGGFYKYSGTISVLDSVVEINLVETSCDYCGELMQENPDGTRTRLFRTKVLTGKLVRDGLHLNGYPFTRSER